MKKAVFLDRDGVINKAIIKNNKPYPPKNLGQLEILPGVSEALSALKNAGYKIIIVTNQPDVSRGKVSKDSVEEINSFLKKELIIDDIRTCYHDDSDSCMNRKPNPGSLFSAAKDHDINLDKSFMIGDRWKDIEAGIRAGCKTIFIDYGYDEKQPEKSDFKFKSLNEACLHILGEKIGKN